MTHDDVLKLLTTIVPIETEQGPGILCDVLARVLGYARERNLRAAVRKLIVAGRIQASQYSERPRGELVLTKEALSPIFECSPHATPELQAGLNAWFARALVPARKRGMPRVSAAVRAVEAVPVPDVLTARERLQEAQVRVEQARFVQSLAAARRAARVLTPTQHVYLAQQAVELALGRAFPLPAEPTARPVGTPEPVPVTATSFSTETARAWGNILTPKGASVPTEGGAPPKAARLARSARAEDFNFGAGPSSEGSEPAPVGTQPPLPGTTDPRAWVLSKNNLPAWSSMRDIALLIGFECTSQKVGLEATALGFREGHEWVKTETVKGANSGREDCVRYLFNESAARALVDAVLLNPTTAMKRALKKRGFVAPTPVLRPGEAVLPTLN